MKQVFKETHNGKEIIVIDFSTLEGKDPFELINYTIEYMKTHKASSTLLLEIVSGVKLSSEIINFLPTYVQEISPYTKKWASVGLGRLLSDRVPFNLKEEITFFETREEGLEYLLK